jgi:hypothetical protein
MATSLTPKGEGRNTPLTPNPSPPRGEGGQKRCRSPYQFLLTHPASIRDLYDDRAEPRKFILADDLNDTCCSRLSDVVERREENHARHVMSHSVGLSPTNGDTVP